MSGREETADAIVIGAGHNGLACALVLAKAGCEWPSLSALTPRGERYAPKR